jgi:hypothetical protein
MAISLSPHFLHSFVTVHIPKIRSFHYRGIELSRVLSTPVSFDKNNHSRIRYKKANNIPGKEVPHLDIVKGFKVGNERVIVEDEEFKRAAPEKKDHLEILQFVNEKKIDAAGAGLHIKAYFTNVSPLPKAFTQFELR